MTHGSYIHLYKLKHKTNKQKCWSNLPRIVSVSIRFFMILSQKPPHMDSSGGGGGSRWLSCILISTCFCILLALVDRRCGAHSKVCQYKLSNQGTLAVLVMLVISRPSKNDHFMKNLFIYVINANRCWCQDCDQDMFANDMVKMQRHRMTMLWNSCIYI